MSIIKDTNFSWAQDGLKDYASDPAAKNFFAGTWDMDQNNLNSYDPFVQGYAYIIWTRLPKFFDGTTLANFKYMTQKNFKAFSGLGDMTLDTDTVSMGFAGNTFATATNLKKSEGNFSLTHQEFSGSPIRQLYEYWITGIRDPETGLATYHGQIASGALNYSMANHTGELMYIVTDASGALGGATAIEYAAYYTNVIPTKIPQDHLNFTAGDHGLTEIQVDFTGVWHKSKEVNNLAVKLLAEVYTLPTFGDYGTANAGFNQLGGSSLGTNV